MRRAYARRYDTDCNVSVIASVCMHGIIRYAAGTMEEFRLMYMSATRHWTIDQLQLLPEDGNKYELVRGELFVTPAPTFGHETVVSILHSLLEPYVRAHALGRIYRPRAIVRIRPHSEVEPDLMVRPVAPPRTTWERAPIPILVIEVTSETTRRRDYVEKRQLYVDLEIPEYWIADIESREVHVVRPGEQDIVVAAELTWHPASAPLPLRLDVASVFREALG
jgi:Uma2 family endonuclease